MAERRSVFAWGRRGGRDAAERIPFFDGYVIFLIVGMTLPKTYQILYFKYMELIRCQLYLNNTVNNFSHA